MTAKSPLSQLSEIISTYVAQIEGRFAESGLEYPNLDLPIDKTSAEESLAVSPDVAQAAQLVVSACGHLAAILKPPALSVYDATGGYHIVSAIRVVRQGNIIEILREAGPTGAHAKEIADKTGLQASKVSRVLRLLATHHIFRELSPDVFTNNKLSSTMDTQKSFDAIKGNPLDKHLGTSGVGAMAEFHSEEMFKGSWFMPETLFDPIAGHSDATEDAPLTRAFNFKSTMYEWLERPENKFRFQRFNVAMDGVAKADPPDAIIKGFDWSQLQPQSVVVDVGGGIGSATMALAKRYPELQYVVQDRPVVIEHADEYWNRELPNMYEKGAVKLQIHDFFSPQPIKHASVFLLRMIVHNYGYKKATVILKHLRDAALPTTKLVIIDLIVPYACHDDDMTLGKSIPGAEQMQPPPPLLPSLGKANSLPYLADFQMLVVLNAEERTLGSLLNVTLDSGWKIERVFSIPGSLYKQIVAIPVNM